MGVAVRVLDGNKLLRRNSCFHLLIGVVAWCIIITGYDPMMMVDCRDVGVSGGVITGSGVGGFSPPSLLREQFAKVCFETLLQFSLVDGISSSSSPSSPSPTETAMASENIGGNDSTADAELITGKLAVTALLHRFQEVVEKFCHDQSLTGKCPLPRSVPNNP